MLPRQDVLAHAWSWTSPWFRYDARWFVGVAQNGYHWGAHETANTNFLPLYPALIHVVQPLTLDSAWMAAWVVANGALLAASILLWRWACLKTDKSTALGVLLLTVCFPFAFFYSAPYSESLFLALAVATFLCAELEHWLWAAIFAGASIVTRPIGIALVAGLIVMAWSRGNRKHAPTLALAAVPLAVFSAYLGVRFGHPLGFLVNHSGGWAPAHGSVSTVIASQFHTYLTPFDRVDAGLAALFLASGVVVWRKLGAGYGVYVLTGVLMPLAHGLVGMERYVVVLFPVMAVWAKLEGKGARAMLFAVSLLGLLTATTMFATGYSLA